MLPELMLAAVVTPSGDPTLKPGLDPASVTPGLPGFLATLFIVVAVIFLIRDMVKRVRRVRYAAEVEEARVLRSSEGGGTPVQPGPGQDDGVGPGEPVSGRNVPPPGGTHGPDNR